MKELPTIELMNIKGGVAIGTAATIIGSAVFIGGIFVGYTDGRKG